MKLSYGMPSDTRYKDYGKEEHISKRSVVVITSV